MRHFTIAHNFKSIFKSCKVEEKIGSKLKVMHLYDFHLIPPSEYLFTPELLKIYETITLFVSVKKRDNDYHY